MEEEYPFMEYELKEVLVEYLKDSTEKHRKKTTIKSYRSILGTCISILEEGGLLLKAIDVQEKTIYFLKSHIKRKEETVKQYITIFNQMIKFATGRDIVGKMGLLWNRAKRRRIFIDMETFIRLYAKANEREKLILILAAFMGLRRKEIGEIRLSDIGHDFIRIHGKGHGEQGFVVDQFMPAAVKREIDKYMVWRNDHNKDLSEGHLLVYKHNGNNLYRYTNPSTIGKIVTELGERCGIKVTTHVFRRLFATYLYYYEKMDIRQLKEQTRHASVDVLLDCYIDPFVVQQENKVSSMADTFAASIA